MGKSRAEIQEQIRQTMVGRLSRRPQQDHAAAGNRHGGEREERDRAGEGGSLARNEVQTDDDVEGERAQFAPSCWPTATRT